MTITYKLGVDPLVGKVTTVLKNDGGTITAIPMNPDNTDYQAYLKFIEDGGQPLPTDEELA